MIYRLTLITSSVKQFNVPFELVPKKIKFYNKSEMEDSGFDDDRSIRDILKDYSFNNDGPIFMMFLSKGCGHCHAFKNNTFKSLMNALEKENKVTPDGITFADMSSEHLKLGKEFPSGLQSLTLWFPMFILVSRRSWNNHDIPLEYYILGAKYTDGKLDIATSGISATVNAISSKINEALKDSTMWSTLNHKSPASSPTRNSQNRPSSGAKIVDSNGDLSSPISDSNHVKLPSYALPLSSYGSANSPYSPNRYTVPIGSIKFVPTDIPIDGPSRGIYDMSHYNVK